MARELSAIVEQDVGVRRQRWFAAITLLGAALLSACAATTPTTRASTGTSGGGAVLVPWQPGNAEAFQAGAAEERGTRAAQGFLPVTIYRPEGAGPFPFVVLLHGCGGLYHEAMWKTWVTPFSPYGDQSATSPRKMRLPSADWSSSADGPDRMVRPDSRM